MRNTGFIPEIKSKDYLFGSSETKLDNLIISPNGDWSIYLPRTERQRKGSLDTWNCVAFSALNVIETFFRYLIKNHLISNHNYEWLIKNSYIDNGQVNFSDRYVGYFAGVKVGVGATASTVANAIRLYGLVPEKMWAFELGMNADYYYKKPPAELKVLGLEFNERFKINFEQFWISDVKEALKYSPVQVFVNAWHKKNGVYYNPNEKTNHAVEMYKWTKIFDHYDPFLKTLTDSYYYFPSGYKYSVSEIINHMNVEDFIKTNDLVWIRNTKTGQFGRIMQGELKVFETDDRATLALLDDKVRTNGRGISDDEWIQLPKHNF